MIAYKNQAKVIQILSKGFRQSCQKKAAFVERNALRKTQFQEKIQVFWTLSMRNFWISMEIFSALLSKLHSTCP